ncbi:uncharacterized protein LOC115833254 [Nomascus leucogenys]|uniref:uncharacterized protein LOC115833254 n=1 Tax=Nomascus leucogenys TaxID=61853 RepID=UPI00122D55D8|nr:uncharacterized protein LOC115833254 [Nomascus leucogenys]
MEGGMATRESRCRRGRIGVQPSPERRSEVVGPFPLARGLSQVGLLRLFFPFFAFPFPDAGGSRAGVCALGGLSGAEDLPHPPSCEQPEPGARTCAMVAAAPPARASGGYLGVPEGRVRAVWAGRGLAVLEH